MIRTTNRVVSIYRNTQTVESLRRIHVVTGTEFPVSGDAPLRYDFERLSLENRLALVKPKKQSC